MAGGGDRFVGKGHGLISLSIGLLAIGHSGLSFNVFGIAGASPNHCLRQFEFVQIKCAAARATNHGGAPRSGGHTRLKTSEI